MIPRTVILYGPLLRTEGILPSPCVAPYVTWRHVIRCQIRFIPKPSRAFCVATLRYLDGKHTPIASKQCRFIASNNKKLALHCSLVALGWVLIAEMEVVFMREQQALGVDGAAFGTAAGGGGGTGSEALVDVPWTEPVIAALHYVISGAATVVKRDDFARLRDFFGWKNERYVNALRTMQPYEVAAGRSGAAFWRSADGSLIAKAVCSMDFKALERIASDYADHLIGEEDSCLSLIVGAYKWDGQNVIVMEAIRPVNGGSRGQFDMKGLRAESGKAPVELSPEAHTKLLNSIKVATAFLERIKVVDYSILVVEREDGNLVVGIIDFLMEYTARRAWRSLFITTGSARSSLA